MIPNSQTYSANRKPYFGTRAASTGTSVRFGKADPEKLQDIQEQKPTGEQMAKAEKSKVAKAYVFSTLIPWLSCGFWLGGPLMGLFLGAPLAYYSAKHGRKLTKELSDPTQMDQVAQAFQRLDEAIRLSPRRNPIEFKQHLTEVGIEAADMLNLKGLKGIGRIVEPLIEWIGKSKLLDSKATFWLLNKYALLRGLSKNSKFFKIERGISVNLRVARATNPISATWEALKGMVFFYLGLWNVGIEIAQALWNKAFGGKKDAQQAS
jgi:hypothetical protein